MAENTAIAFKPGGTPPTRGAVIQDVLILQLKLFAGNMHNLVLVPMTLGGAGLDILLPSRRRSGYFYRALAWGRRAEKVIDIYSALGPQGAAKSPDISAASARLKIALSKELEQGSTVAGLSSVVEGVLAQLRQSETPPQSS